MPYGKGYKRKKALKKYIKNVGSGAKKRVKEALMEKPGDRETLNKLLSY